MYNQELLGLLKSGLYREKCENSASLYNGLFQMLISAISRICTVYEYDSWIKICTI